MKKIVTVSAMVAMSALVVLGLASPAVATPTMVGPLASTGQYGAVAVSSDGSLVALSAEYAGVTIYDVGTQVSRTITTPSTDAGFPVFSPDNKLLFVASYSPKAVYVYDLSNNDNLVQTVTMPEEAWNLAISPDGGTLYVVSYGLNLYTVAVTNGYAVSSSPIDLGGSTNAMQICLSSDGATLYVPDSGGNRLQVVNGGNLQVTSWATSANQPDSCSLDNDGNVYVANRSNSSIDKFTADGTRTTSEAAIAQSIYAIGASCDTLYVGDYNLSDLTPLSLSDLAVSTDIQVPGSGGGWQANSAARSADGAVIAFGGKDATDSILILESPECASAPTPPTPTLPDSGASQVLVIALASVGGGLVVIGFVAMILVRRRTPQA